MAAGIRSMAASRVPERSCWPVESCVMASSCVMQHCQGRGAGLRLVQEAAETWMDGQVLLNVYLTFRVLGRSGRDALGKE